MPPKSRKVKEAAAAKIRQRAQDEEAAEPEPLTASSATAIGFKAWKTSTKLATGGELEQTEARWNVAVRRYTQALVIHHNESFTLKPLVITEGKFDGRHVLMLEPVENDGGHFRFLDLPPELRKMVYDLLLDGNQTIKIQSHKPPHKARRPVIAGFKSRHTHRDMKWDASIGKWDGQQPGDLSIMGVNKQLHDEAAPAIYGDRIFDLNTFGDAQVFLETVGSYRTYLKHIKVSSDEAFYKTTVRPMFGLLSELSGLRCLEISHDILCDDNYRWRRRISLGIFVELCKPFMKASHKARKADPNAVQALDLIKVGPTDTCFRCKVNDPEHCSGLSCRRPYNGRTEIKCVDKKDHDESVGIKLRAGLAKVLGIIKDV